MKNLVTNKKVWFFVAVTVIVLLTFYKINSIFPDIEKPEITEKDLILKIKQNEGLYCDDQQLINVTKWYLYQGSRDIIDQLIENLKYEADIEFKFAENYASIKNIQTGCSYYMLKDCCKFSQKTRWFNKNHLCDTIDQVLHEKLYVLSKSEDNVENFLYLVLELIEKIESEKKDEKIDGAYVELHNPIENNIKWYTHESVRNDLLAYLRIYETYNHNSYILEIASDFITSHYELWLNHVDQWRVIQKIKDFGGADQAFNVLEPFIRPGVPLYDKKICNQLSSRADAKKYVSPFMCSKQSVICGNWMPIKNEHAFWSKPIMKDNLSLQSSYCPLCQSIRILNFENHTARMISPDNKSPNPCEHYWIPGIHSLSMDTIKEGDCLVAYYAEKLFCIRIGGIKEETVCYSIAGFILADNETDTLDLTQLKWENKSGKNFFYVGNRGIYFKIADTKETKGLNIWYDYYYGGFPEKATFEKDEVMIGIVHKTDISNDNIIKLNCFRFKTWEDGLGNRCDILKNSSDSQ